MKYLFLFSFFFYCSALYSQKDKEYNVRADKFVEQKQYNNAFSLYAQGVNAGDEYSIRKMIDLYWNQYIELEDLDPYFDIVKNRSSSNPAAAFLTGQMLLEGVGCKKDEKEAIRFLLISSEEKDVRGMMTLAYCYHEGIGTVQNVPAAIKWLEKSLDVQQTRDQYRPLADMYSAGRGGVKPDSAKATGYYRLAAKYGKAEDSIDLGRSLMNAKFGPGIEKNNQEAFGIFTKLKDDYLLAILYSGMMQNGQYRGVKTNIPALVAAYSEIIEDTKEDYTVDNRFINCYLEVAHYYFWGNTGKGVDWINAEKFYSDCYSRYGRDVFPEQDFEQFTKAVYENHLALNNKIGKTDFVKGKEQRDYLRKAREFYLTIKDPKLPDTYLNIALLTSMLGSVRDAFGDAMKAYNNTTDPAIKGEAANLIGLYYEKEGGSRVIDYPTAFKYYKAGAEYGNTVCMLRLCSMYNLGTAPGGRSKSEARAWAQKALDGGNKDAQSWVDDLK